MLRDIECQLQTRDQYQKGNYGYAAHTKMAGKSIEQLELPKDETDENVSNLVEKIRKISPFFCEARIDDKESSRVIISFFSIDEAYRRLLRESESTDALEYCDQLYMLSQRHPKYFQRGDKLSYMNYDITKYLESNKLKSLIAKTLKSYEYDK